MEDPKNWTDLGLTLESIPPSAGAASTQKRYRYHQAGNRYLGKRLAVIDGELIAEAGAAMGQ